MLPEVAWLLAVLSLIALAWVGAKKFSADRQLRRVAEEKARLERTLTERDASLQVLSKYQMVADAEAEAARIQAEAQRTSQDLLTRATEEAAALKAQAATMQKDATEAARKIREQANATMASASAEASKILAAARKRAEEIGGEAYAAMQNADQLKMTVRTLKNVIEGYGDQYLVPTYSLLDSLAEEFGFSEAGQKLKLARERTRHMVKTATAADCDYAEENRRTTAIAFVLDAFNGKVDSILADVRHDNFGTLEQKIRDASNLVNLNGQAFRNARILPEYLDAPLCANIP